MPVSLPAPKVFAFGMPNDKLGKALEFAKTGFLEKE